MLFKTKISMLTLVALSSLSAHSQSLPEPLVQAARKAVVSNPEVQARWNGFKAAANERDVARGGFLPQVDLTASLGHENRDTPLANYGNYGFNATQLTLNQMLFDGKFTSSEVKRLGYAKLTRYYELAEASETAALEAVRAYADVVRYRELVDVATQNYVEHKQTTQQVEERANAGVGRRVDVEQANGRLALAESNLLTELTNLHDVSTRYLRVIGDKPPASLPSLPEPFKLGTLPASTDILMNEGLQGSPTLNAAVENVRAYKTAIETRKSAYLPRIDLRAYASGDNNTGGVSGDTRVSGVQLVLNYNFYRGGADKARERQAVDQKEQARDLQEKACRDVRQTLSIAYSDVRSLNEQLRYLDQHRLSTEKSREAYRQQFEIGQRTLLDLLDSQNEYFEATRAYISARHNQISAQARTLAGMGRLVSALGVSRADVPSAQDAGQDRSSIDPAELCPLQETGVDSIEKILAETVIPSRARTAPAAGERLTLLPNADGSVGVLVVTKDKGAEVRLDKAYGAAQVDASGIQYYQSSAAEVKEKYQRAVEAVPVAATYYRLYFVIDQATLLPESQATLKAVLADFRNRPAPEIRITGHTDKSGNPKYNEHLSRRRALAVKSLLTAAGAVPVVDIETAWRGDRDPVPGTAGRKYEPRNRRVEVKVQ